MARHRHVTPDGAAGRGPAGPEKTRPHAPGYTPTVRRATEATAPEFALSRTRRAIRAPLCSAILLLPALLLPGTPPEALALSVALAAALALWTLAARSMGAAIMPPPVSELACGIVLAVQLLAIEGTLRHAAGLPVPAWFETARAALSVPFGPLAATDLPPALAATQAACLALTFALTALAALGLLATGWPRGRLAWALAWTARRRAEARRNDFGRIIGTGAGANLLLAVGGLYIPAGASVLDLAGSPAWLTRELLAVFLLTASAAGFAIFSLYATAFVLIRRAEAASRDRAHRGPA